MDLQLGTPPKVLQQEAVKEVAEGARGCREGAGECQRWKVAAGSM